MQVSRTPGERWTHAGQERRDWLREHGLQLVMTALLGVLSVAAAEVLDELRALTDDVRAVLVEQSGVRREIEAMRRDNDRSEARLLRLEEGR